MKSAVIFLIVFTVFATPRSTRAADGTPAMGIAGELIALRDSHDLALISMGVMKFCKKKGLEEAILANVIRSASAVEISREKLTTFILLADSKAVGVAIGLGLAELSENEKNDFCMGSLELADDALKRLQSPPSEP